IAISLFLSVASLIPNPNSALSSKSEFDHAGPRPNSFVVHGVVGRLPPKMDEQPVALATNIRSPNNCVSNFKYGVSPQPLHAPENSNNGSSSCEPLTVALFTLVLSISGNERKKSQFFFSVSFNGNTSTISIAL